MRILLGVLFTVSLVVIGGYITLKGYPYKLYSSWVRGQGWNKYYKVEGYKASYLAPTAVEEIPVYKEDYGQLWKEFPLRNSLIPLPVRHPLFKTVPLLESTGPKGQPQLGMVFLSSGERELSRIYTLPMSLYQDHSHGQDLFELPYVRKTILKFPVETVWKDLFSHRIEVRSKSLEKMIYDLYILHLRSKILPAETVRYGLIKNGESALVELASKDQDYMLELVLTYDNGSIYSYVLKTEKRSEDSRALRAKFLETVSFTPVDRAMSEFLYKEFKQLNFARQVDQEGMLYLFSAWSQDLQNVDMLKEMIFYLERGRTNAIQLRALYKFALKQYGKTFTTRKIWSDHEDPNIALQRKIEIEEIEKKLSLEREAPVPHAELTPDEKMNLYLKKVKEELPGKPEDMTIH